MTAPKPGDRVRITYEGFWDDDPAEFKGIRGLVRQVDNEGIRHDFPAYAHVEVIRAGQVVTP
jgi:hypothetical protein